MEAKVKKSKNAPSFFNVMLREIVHDKLSLVSSVILIGLILFVFIAALFIDSGSTSTVNLMYVNKPPSAQFWLGTDPSGRDMVGQLIVGARNSFSIAFSVTAICMAIGIVVGLTAGYYGGQVDNLVMRGLDFFSMLPSLMIIIVIISIIPKYNVFTFVLVMSIFLWMGDARLIRAKTLQQSNLDYVRAAKTLGSTNIRIMFMQVLPNITSIIVVNGTLTLAANMGLETGLTFLGFGLPFNTPSLGSLLRYASVPENMQNRSWQWLPAALLILVMMLCINFVGQAIKRAADAKQRIG